MGAKLSGGGGGKKGSMTPNSEPNVIPFIDIMLVLLIIFMVAAPLPTVDIKVDLPPPNSIPPDTPPLDKPTFVFLEDVSGQLVYLVGDKPVTLQTLETVLYDSVKTNNPTRANDPTKLFLDAAVYVKADQETAYANVVEMMSVIDDAGFKKVSLVAEEAQF